MNIIIKLILLTVMIVLIFALAVSYKVPLGMLIPVAILAGAGASALGEGIAELIEG